MKQQENKEAMVKFKIAKDGLWCGLGLWVVSRVIPPFSFWSNAEDLMGFVVITTILSALIIQFGKGKKWARLLLSLFAIFWLCASFSQYVLDESSKTLWKTVESSRFIDMFQYASALSFTVGIVLSWCPSLKECFDPVSEK